MNSDSITEDNYSISTDKDRLDRPLIHRYLSSSSYWAIGRPYATVVRSIENSLCFGVYAAPGRQVGFARVVTDHCTIAWLCDVFILEPHRGKNLGKRLVQEVVSHPELAGIRRILLATDDAHELYSRYGQFQALHAPEKWMERLV